MTNVNARRFETTLLLLEEKIGCYRRRSSAKKSIALRYADEGLRKSADFNKGQAFSLEYVADDLAIVLASLQDLLHAEVPDHVNDKKASTLGQVLDEIADYGCLKEHSWECPDEEFDYEEGGDGNE